MNRSAERWFNLKMYLSKMNILEEKVFVLLTITETMKRRIYDVERKLIVLFPSKTLPNAITLRQR